MPDRTITVNIDHTASLDKRWFASQGERITVDVVLAAGLWALGYDGYVDFILPDGSTCFKGPYDCSSGTISLTLGALDSVLDKDGKVWWQFVLAVTTGSVREIMWLSEQYESKVLPSIFATTSAILPYVPQMMFPVQYPAENISVADVAERFLSTEVEGALQEVGSQLAEIASISLYSDDLIAALAAVNYVYIPDGKTISVTRTLIASDLQGKKILGAGKGHSVIHFVGDIDCFDFDSCTDFSLNDVTIQVDTNNAHVVLKPTATTAEVKFVKIDNVEIRATDVVTLHALGVYTGVDILATAYGTDYCHFNNIDMYFPRKGIYLHGDRTGATNNWITSNYFLNPVIRGYREIGIGIEITGTAGDVTIQDNEFINSKILALQELTYTTRKGYIIGGTSNIFTGISHWNDSGDFSATNYGLVFDVPYRDIPNNLVIGGHVEGEILNLEYAAVNNCNFKHLGPINAIVTSKIRNIIPNPNFTMGTKKYTVSGGTMAVADDLTSPSGKTMTLTCSGSSMAFYPTIVNKQKYLLGKTVLFIVCLKSEDTVQIIVDETTLYTTNIVYPYGSGYGVYVVARKITENNAFLGLEVLLTGAGSTVDIAYMYAHVIDEITEKSGLDVENIELGITKNYGTFTITSGTTYEDVSHGMDRTPDASDIQVVPTSSLGAAKCFYVTAIDAGMFEVILDVDPGIDVTFAWKINIV